MVRVCAVYVRSYWQLSEWGFCGWTITALKVSFLGAKLTVCRPLFRVTMSFCTKISTLPDVLIDTRAYFFPIVIQTGRLLLSPPFLMILL
jgi:hypothetical protein